MVEELIEKTNRAPQLVEDRQAADLTQLLAAIKPATTQQKILETETAKAIIWKVTESGTLEMTTNINSSEELTALKGLLYWYQISGNPRVAVEYIAHLTLSKSRSDRGSISLLEGLFSFMNAPGNDSDGVGRFGRLKQLVSGR